MGIPVETCRRFRRLTDCNEMTARDLVRRGAETLARYASLEVRGKEHHRAQ
jgi:hypothetical protein